MSLWRGTNRVLRTLVRVRSMVMVAGVSALVAFAADVAPAAASCVYSPGGSLGAAYFVTDSAGNSGNVYQNGACNGFWMSRGYLNPSYENWRGWLYQSASGSWYTNGYHYDGTVGQGVLLESAVAYNTYEHAQISSSTIHWRNQEYH